MSNVEKRAAPLPERHRGECSAGSRMGVMASNFQYAIGWTSITRFNFMEAEKPGSEPQCPV
jgi:hypothetical protein